MNNWSNRKRVLCNLYSMYFPLFEYACQCSCTLINGTLY